jgi:hypothetical protein
VWDIPGSTDVQTAFTLRNLESGFVWGELRNELFNANQPDDGWVGATRAMLLAYAVNAPAVVVGRYKTARNSASLKYSPEWCLDVLRGVIVDSGVDVWKARWPASVPLVERAFGVKLPTYAQLVARAWVVNDPTPPPEPELTFVSVPDVKVDVITSEPIRRPDPPPTAPASTGIFDVVATIVRVVMEVMSRVFGQR